MIDHQTEPGLIHAGFPCDYPRRKEKLPQCGFMSRSGSADPGNDLLWYDKHVNGCLGFNIVKCDQVIGFMHDAGRNFPSDDFFEDRHGTQLIEHQT